ncbi:peptidoglycan-associated lipoprotein Pal [Halioglobus maricola]|uniref:Peptidoglycan-associated lipoprotein n=1 Tax=Halioglobus maricola TaxID=2601894 RepID=A0A5P9NGT5_9GAMM|nr:peptidoglycan-associated lipoprotein Pal [Halioglobus maricola]QFU74755.1 peptidoglycan-associated lipoprotein Pal [Halioglobus maricola]
MKHLPVAGKAITLLFAAAFLAACSGNSKEQEEAAAAAAAAAEAARVAEQQAIAAQQAEQQRFRDAAIAAGSVFFFDYDSYTLKPEALAALDAHISYLASNNDTVRLEGHTDERGTREYNMALGERRANAVRDYMVVNGVSGTRIETVSYGEERPNAYGSGEANWSQNRRVELK